MGMDVEKTLTESAANRNVEDGIVSQLVQLNPIDKEKSLKELMNRDRKAAKEEVGEDY
jgi:hypothetical protein